MNKISFTLAVLCFGAALTEAKRGAPPPVNAAKSKPAVVLQSEEGAGVPEPGPCCWTMDHINHRNDDKPELCGIQWTNYINYCF